MNSVRSREFVQHPVSQMQRVFGTLNSLITNTATKLLLLASDAALTAQEPALPWKYPKTAVCVHNLTTIFVGGKNSLPKTKGGRYMSMEGNKEVHYPNINAYVDRWYNQYTTCRVGDEQQQSRLEGILLAIILNFVEVMKRYQIRRIK